ncbi:MAG TPA: hypothetical protein VFS16_12760 [Acidimicrobiia bacterium]|nr:hypothetical protein [Acidimicrobiia bacterium]
MDQPDPDVLDAVLSMALAAGVGDDEAVELLLRGNDPADLAVVGADVIWRMAAAVGQLVEPKRSPPQMIHAFAQALREPPGE